MPYPLDPLGGGGSQGRYANAAGLHGTIPSRVGVVLPFLLPCSIQTPTRQRLILTRSPINLDLFRNFGGGGPSHRLRTNLSYIEVWSHAGIFVCVCSADPLNKKISIIFPF